MSDRTGDPVTASGRGYAERAEARRATVEQLHAQLADRISKLEGLQDWQEWLHLMQSLHRYSFNNTLLILAQKPDATMVAGFGVWKQRGHSVRKGEKAIRVLAPIKKAVDLYDMQGNPLRDANGRPRYTWQVVGVKPVSVFDASQVEPAVKVPPQPRLLTGQAPPGLWDSLAELASIGGFSVTRGDCGTANGFINFTDHEIRIRPDVDDLQACKTLAHEIGHSLTMTQGDAGSVGAHRELREVEAESIAYAVLGAHGVDTSRYTFDYVAGWAARAATTSTSITDVIIATGQRVIAAADRILSHTKPLRDLEDQFVDDWDQTVRPAPPVAATKPRWEVVAEAPSNGLRAERSAAPPAPQRTPGVPR